MIAGVSISELLFHRGAVYHAEQTLLSLESWGPRTVLLPVIGESRFDHFQGVLVARGSTNLLAVQCV